METDERSIVVDAPVQEAYARWSDLTSFPSFMDTVKSVTKTGPDMYHWTTSVGPTTQQFDVRAAFVPNQSVSWKSTSGDQNAGTVTFTPEGANRTKITVRLEFQPSNPIESIGANLTDQMGNDLESALQKFKSQIESNQPVTR